MQTNDSIPLSNDAVHLFVGPTLYLADGRRLHVPADIHLHEPARRGDIPAVINAHADDGAGVEPGVIVLVDGFFQQHLAVGHLELRAALERGWEVHGLSSMGAIRAYEMREMGMRGHGRVYRMFETGKDFQDDEVALLHEPVAPYRAFSEPLVHCRFAAAQWVEQGWLSAQGACRVLEHLKSLWFGERSLELFQALVMETISPAQTDLLRQEIQRFDAYRLKTLDLEEFLRTDSALRSARARK